jgi:hypothetical protein
MARITITAEIAGINKIDAPKFQGTIIKFWETYDSNGREKFRLWSAWFTQDQTITVNEKDIITITGDLATSVGSYTKKGEETTTPIVNHNLNNCTVQLVKSSTEAKPAEVIGFDAMPF